MAILTGTSVTVGIHTSEQITDTRFVKDIERDVTKYEDVSSPLFRFFTKMQGRVLPAIQPKYSWQENQLEYGMFTANIAAALAGATQTITYDYPAAVVGDTLLVSETSEQLIVDSVTSRSSTTSTVVVRQIPLSAATTVQASATLIFLGTTIVEKGWAPEAIGTQPKEISNIVGFTSGSAAISTVAMYSQTYYGNQWETDKEKVMRQYLKNMERTALFSRYAEEAAFVQAGAHGSSTNTLRTTRGIIPHLSSNIDTYTAPLTKIILDDFCRDFAFNPKYAGSKTKMVLCGRNALADIQADLSDQIRIYGAGETAYGIDIGVYYVYGSRKLIFMEESEFHEPTKYKGAMLFLDPDKLYLKQLGESFLNIEHTKNPQQYADMISLWSMIGVIAKMEQAHSLLWTA